MTNRRTVLLSVRLSPLESLDLQSRAARANLTTSAFVRALMNEGYDAAIANPLALHDAAQFARILDIEGLHDHADTMRGIIRQLQ